MQQRRNQRQRQSQSVVVIIIVAVVALLVVGALIALNPPKSPTAASSTSAITQSYVAYPQDIDTTAAIGLAIGQQGSPVTLIEYSDFGCPHCRDLAPTITQLINQYVKTGGLRIVYKPVTFVRGAVSVAAARAGICAARQNKFWEMQDQIWAIFDSNGPDAYSDALFSARAADLGLDTAKFSECYDSTETMTAIQGVADEVKAIGVDGTPTLFLNGQKFAFTGPDSLKQAIQSRLSTQTPTTLPTATQAP
jgi:protein-disulfide isomerase